jgi:hypothetical protein
VKIGRQASGLPQEVPLETHFEMGWNLFRAIGPDRGQPAISDQC